MPVPSLPENANARQLAEALKASAAEAVQLRSKEQLTDDDKAQLRSHVAFIKDIDPLLAAQQSVEDFERSTARGDSQGPTAAFDTPQERSLSLGEEVTGTDTYRDFTRSKGAAGAGAREIHLERALVDSDTTGAGNGGMWIPTGTPRFPQPTGDRRLFLRALLSRITTTLPSLPYIQETNKATNDQGAATVAEGAQKPEVSLQWEQKDAPVRKIAAWIPLTEEIIEDAPALRGYIDNRLLYMLQLEEEQQFLNGNGTAPNIRGIRQTTGLQTQAAQYEGATTGSKGDVPATIGLAIGKVENVDGEADGVAMNPLDYWEAVVQRHADQFDNGFGGNAPAVLSSITWGLPVIRTRALERGVAIVAAWRLGATVIDRKEAVIRVGNQHLDYFTTNKVAVLAEERVGLAVDKPANFVETVVSFAKPA